MGNRKAGLAAVFIAVIVIIIGIVVLGSKDNTSNQPGTVPAGNSAGSRRGPSYPVSADKVTIQNFAFSPADIIVKQGTKVTWTNQGSTQHTVTESDGQFGPQSSPLSPGKSYSFLYKRVGVFHYHCLIHPEMKGTVSVTR